MSQSPSKINIDAIKGVGSARSEKINKLNIRTIADLIYYFPDRYENRKKFCCITDADLDKNVLLRVEVVKKQIK